MDTLQKATRQHTRDHNSRLVLRAVYEAGQISRADLARLTNLTRTTISEVVGNLIERGLVQEVGTGAVAVGRSPILVSVVEDARLMLAVSLTASELQGALVNLRGVVRQRANRPLTGQVGIELVEQLYRFVDELVALADRPLLGIGISTPGLIDTTSGVVRRAVNFGWRDLPLGPQLHERYHLPVYLANDSHTMALAEYMFGQGQSAPNQVVVNVGQGIGAGIVLGGQLFAGDGHGAGEIGHVVVVEAGALCNCGNHGCLETVAGRQAIVNRARALYATDAGSALHQFAGDAAAVDFEAVVAAFQAGDPALRQLIIDIGRFLGIAVANLVGVLNIQRIAISGRVAVFGSVLRDAVRAEVARRALPTLVQATTIDVLPLGPETVLLGAAALLLTNELGLLRLTARVEN